MAFLSFVSGSNYCFHGGNIDPLASSPGWLKRSPLLIPPIWCT